MKPIQPEAGADVPRPFDDAPEPESGDAYLPPEDAAALETAAQELARAKDGWLRAEAELQNVRRRALRDADDAVRRAEEETLSRVLPVVDDLERALEAAQKAGEGESALAKGVALVLSRLLDTLEKSGVVAVDPHGKPFDPTEHEALLTAPSDAHEAGVVSQVIARGFKLRDRLVRPARVVVSSGPQGELPATGGD